MLESGQQTRGIRQHQADEPDRSGHRDRYTGEQRDSREEYPPGPRHMDSQRRGRGITEHERIQHASAENQRDADDGRDGPTHGHSRPTGTSERAHQPVEYLPVGVALHVPKDQERRDGHAECGHGDTGQDRARR